MPEGGESLEVQVALVRAAAEAAHNRIDSLKHEQENHHVEDDQRFEAQRQALAASVEKLQLAVETARTQHTRENNDLRRTMTNVLVAIITGSIGIIGAVLIATFHH